MDYNFIDGTPVFETIEDAVKEAQRLGCKGYHSYQHEGREVYMPCKDHDEILEIIDSKGQNIEDVLKDNQIIGVRIIDDPESVSKRYMEKLADSKIDGEKFYRIVSNPNESSILDLPFRRFRYIYAPGDNEPDLIDTSRSFCRRMMGGIQRVYRYEDIMDLSAQLEVEDVDRKIIPRPKNSGPVDIWVWKGGAGCKHRFLELMLEPTGYIYNNAQNAQEQAIFEAPAAGNTGQINLPPNYASGFAKVGERGAIVKSDKAPKSDTPNPSPKGEGSAKGDAKSTRGAEVSARVEKILEDKVKDFNERYKEKLGYGANKGALKSVYQRGLGAYNTSHSPNVNSAEQWALARVNAFLYLLKNGRPENSKYVNDNDLLPKDHPKYSKEEFDYDVSSLSPYATTSGDTMEIEQVFIKKKPYERQDAYIQRCMSALVSEFPDEKQRYAVCISDFESFSTMKTIVFDLDGVLIEDGKPNMKAIEYLDDKKEDYHIVIISGRPAHRLDETIEELEDLGIDYDDLYLQDLEDETTGDVAQRFKTNKVKKMIDAGFNIIEAISADSGTLAALGQLGIGAYYPGELDVLFRPTAFAKGKALFDTSEEAFEYSQFCGCGGYVYEYEFMGKKLFMSCGEKKDSQAFSLEEDKRLIYAPVMTPGKVIPRLDSMGGKYFVTFTPETIKKMAYKYMKEKRTDKVNYEHSDQKFQDVFMVESWIIESDNDKAYKYFSPDELPIGTWMSIFKVDNDEVWNNYVKANKVKGISLQGNFLYGN